MLAPFALNTPTSLAQAPTPREDSDRKQAMALAWKAYRGTLPNPLKVEPGDTDCNVKPNRCEPIVNKGVSFLFGSELKIEITDEATDTPVEDSPLQETLDGMWGDGDEKMTTLAKAGINGGVFGQPFLKLIPPSRAKKYPRIVNLNPQIIRVVTLPDDVDTHIAYIIEYPGRGDVLKKQIIARVDPTGDIETTGEDDIEDSWTITNYQKSALRRNDPWTQVGPVEAWPYPFAPIQTCQNMPNPNEAWGTPDLTPDLIEMNKVLQFHQSNMEKIVYFHGHPRTIGIGLRAREIETSVGGVLCLPSPDSKLDTLKPMDNFDGLLRVAASLRDDMDEQSRVPAVALGRLEALPKGNISGVALQLLFQPLIEKTTQKRRLYGALIRAVSRAGLVLAGKIGVEQWEDFEIGIHWENLLPIDDLAAAQTAQLLQQLGVSQATLMQQLGYDPDEEVDKKSVEDGRKMTAFSRGQGFPPSTSPQQQQQQDSPFIGRDGGNQHNG